MPQAAEAERNDMPRERALSLGLSALGDAELLAIILGTGAVHLSVTAYAAALLDEVGGIERLARMAPRVLAAQPGLGTVKALRIAAGFELARRAKALEARPRARLGTSKEVAAYAAQRLSPLDHEEMWVVALDGQNGVRAFRRVAQGGLHGCSVAARDILRTALHEAASAMVLVHNHPSGDPTPSVEDIAMTRVVAEAADLVGIALVDHVVVSRGAHASMLDLGILP